MLFLLLHTEKRHNRFLLPALSLRDARLAMTSSRSSTAAPLESLRAYPASPTGELVQFVIYLAVVLEGEWDEGMRMIERYGNLLVGQEILDLT
jgi:hypothetical protein